MTTLDEIMTREVFLTEAGATVSDVANRMLRGRFGSALVVDGSTLLGIFTERDVLRATASGVDPASAPVSDWMTADPVTAEGLMDAGEAVEVMMSNGFRHLPVLDGARIAGIVSLRDIVRTHVGRRD